MTDQERRIRFGLIAALCGALGVASGFAIFLIHGKIEGEPEKFFGALLVAALVSYVIEWLRDLIRVGEIEAGTHPIVRSLGTFVVVLVFELFIAGFDKGFELGLPKVLEVANGLLGPETTAVQGVPWTVVLVSGVWVVAGALLAAWLSVRVGDEMKTVDALHMGRSAGWGTLGGMVIAPLVIGAYIFLGRCLVTLEYFAKATPEMASQYPSLAGFYRDHTHSSPSGWIALFDLPMEGLRVAASHGLWVFWLSYGGLFFAMILTASWLNGRTAKNKDGSPIANIVMLGAMFAVFSPVLRSVWAVLTQLMHKGPLEAFLGSMLSGAIIWGVPGLLLGALVPLLRRAGRSPQSWAFIGYGAAALLIVASLLTGHYWALLPALVASAAGLLFQRGMPVKEFWPFAALCVAIGVSGAMSVAQKVTFAGVLGKLHTIDELKPTPPAPVQAALPVKQPMDSFLPAPSMTTSRPQMTPEQLQALMDQLTKKPGEQSTPRRALTVPSGATLEKKQVQTVEPLNIPAPGEASKDWRTLLDKQAEPPVSAPAPAAAPQHTEAPPASEAKKEPEAVAKKEAETPGKKNDEDGPPESPEEAAKALEISIAGSVGFWTTVGLLACWSMWEREEEETEHAEAA